MAITDGEINNVVVVVVVVDRLTEVLGEGGRPGETGGSRQNWGRGCFNHHRINGRRRIVQSRGVRFSRTLTDVAVVECVRGVGVCVGRWKDRTGRRGI